MLICYRNALVCGYVTDVLQEQRTQDFTQVQELKRLDIKYLKAYTNTCEYWDRISHLNGVRFFCWK